MTESRPTRPVAMEQPNGTRVGAPRRSRGRSAALVAGAVLGVLALGAGAGLQSPGARVALAERAGDAPLVAVPAPAAVPDGAARDDTSPTPTPTPSASRAPSADADPPGTEPPSTPKRKATAVPTHGSGKFVVADASTKARGKGRLITFSVQVERGMPFDADSTARFIAGVLNDRRSWTGTGRWRFKLVDDPKKAELHAWIASPDTTDDKCAPLLTRGAVSCQSGDDVVLNAMRWQQGAEAYGSNLFGYRRYLVNHEFGHYLGYGHVGCPGKGKPAPVMMQQTKGVGSCKTNPWPASDPD